MHLRPDDRILFLGDSITEQHLWTLYLENLLLWHEPSLVIRNRGWAANRAVDGLARFDRDVAPLAPNLIFIAFGMNDGRYQPPAGPIEAEYESSLVRLVRRARAIGAEPLLCSPTAVDEACDPVLQGYNETLARLAALCQQVAEREGAGFIDLFHPTRAAGPGLTFDGIHPNPRGHLVAARAAAEQLGLSEKAVLADDGTADPRLLWASGSGDALRPELRYSVYVDGERCGNYTGAELSKEVLLSGGGLRARARAVMSLSQALWQMDRAAWRSFGPLGLDGARSGAAAESLRASAARLEAERRTLLQKPFAVTCQREEPVPLGPWAVSGPYYPDSPAQLLTQPFAPEEELGADPAMGANPAPVAWCSAEPVGPEGYIDLVPILGPATQAVAYAACTFVAPADGELLLRLGSDDGYRLFLNGRLAADLPVFRGSVPGQELHRLPVRQGPNRLLLRIHQGIGGWDFYASAYLRPNGG